MTTLSAPTRTWHFWAAWLIVGLLFAGILTDVALHPDKHTTMPTYRLATTQWWQGIDPYSDRQHDGFFYFPQAAVLFTPFNLPGFMGDLTWRMASFGLFLYALVRLARREKFDAKAFLILCLLAVPSSMASLRNAQFDLPLAALVLLTTVEVAESRWTWAAVWICIAVALKPLGVVPMLLFTALYGRPLIPRVAVGMLIVVALPFLHWSPAFVAHEYVRCFEALTQASKGDEPRYSDLAALLSKAGLVVPIELRTGIRVLFALVYLGLGALALRRNRAWAAWIIGALAADYLMLFNPRTETCSYVFLGPFVASLALIYAAERRRWIAYALGFAAICLACDAFPKLGHFSLHNLTDRWLKPLVALLFLPVLIELALGRANSKAPLER